MTERAVAGLRSRVGCTEPVWLKRWLHKVAKVKFVQELFKEGSAAKSRSKR